MRTPGFVLGSVLVVAAEIAVATAHYDGSDASGLADRIEEQLDRQLQDWLHRSFDLATRQTAPHRTAR
jgi:hypothetical protein